MAVVDALGKCKQVVENHESILVSVSGGSDSDVMMDLLLRCGGREKTTFVFFNTGLEYEATKRHLQELNEKHGVEIQHIPPIKPIPLCVREHGIPFWSKHVSEMMMRLQKHNFQWEEEPFEELIVKYPRCKSALQWWCNAHEGHGKKPSSLNIAYIRGLKEFIIANPPTFRISNKCCHYAKKEPAKKYLKSHHFDVSCVGIRQAEGGVRATRYKTCFSDSQKEADQYRPLFWFTDADKKAYEEHYGIKHSDCYEVWGMKRTGCAGCPFNLKWKEELILAEKYEPKFHKAMMKVFAPSYAYRLKFEKFRKEMKAETTRQTNNA